jgi:hypothetical protein
MVMDIKLKFARRKSNVEIVQNLMTQERVNKKQLNVSTAMDLIQHQCWNRVPDPEKSS